MSAPGLYIRYLDNQPNAVSAQSTSVAVFIGSTIIGGSITAGTNEVTPTRITSISEYVEKFTTKGASSGAVSLPTNSRQDVVDHMGIALEGFYGNGGQQAFIVSTKEDGTGLAAHAEVLLKRNSGDDDGDGIRYAFRAKSFGEYGNDLSVLLSRSARGEGFVDVLVTLTFDASNSIVQEENLLGLAFDELATISSSLIEVSIDTNPGGLPNEFSTQTDDPDANPPTLQLALQNGQDSTLGSASMASICERLQDYDDISIIVLPGADYDDANQADYGTAIAHAQAMKDRMVLIQIANDQDLSTLGLPTTQYASAFYPYGSVSIKNGAGQNQVVSTGLTGHIAGVFARVDSEYGGPWAAPAGKRGYLSGVISLGQNISQIRHGPINDDNINVVRYIDGTPTLYGARTRANGTYQYIPVTRTAFLIADSLRASLSDAVFKMNTQVLWTQLKASANGFLNRLNAQGAMQGENPFEVYCGLGESMTEADILAGMVYLTVYVNFANPAELIEITIGRKLEEAA